MNMAWPLICDLITHVYKAALFAAGSEKKSAMSCSAPCPEAVASSSEHMAEEWEQEEDIDQPVTADMTLRVLLRYLKRHQTRLSTKFKYGFLEKDAVENILPEPSAFPSKRSWERAMHRARFLLRDMADNFDKRNNNGVDPGKSIFQAQSMNSFPGKIILLTPDVVLLLVSG